MVLFFLSRSEKEKDQAMSHVQKSSSDDNKENDEKEQDSESRRQQPMCKGKVINYDMNREGESETI